MVQYLDMDFDWDKDKAKANVGKHRVTFNDAMTAFGDANAIIKDDDEHSLDEERFILLGISKESHLLMVCHCYRDNDNVIRIISARKANRHEENEYGGY